MKRNSARASKRHASARIPGPERLEHADQMFARLLLALRRALSSAKRASVRSNLRRESVRAVHQQADAHWPLPKTTL